VRRRYRWDCVATASSGPALVTIEEDSLVEARTTGMGAVMADRRDHLRVGAVILLVMIASACAVRRSEMRYVSDLCEAHPLVGLTDEIHYALSMRYAKLRSWGLNASKGRAMLLQQELNGYSTDWQHLHQSMITACRDFAICRYRETSPEASRCDELRDRLDRITAAGREFLVQVRTP
jgi:hypothetical protein